MLTRIDRIQLVVPATAPAAAAFFRVLEAELDRHDSVVALGARRVVLRLGASEVELLEPDGAGRVADFLARTGGGLFAAGAATHELDRFAAHLRAGGVSFAEEGRQLFIGDVAPGLNVVVSAEPPHAPVGLVRHLYEVTYLVPDAATAADRIAVVLGLDPRNFVPISSVEFGYSGVLTLFQSDQLDRIEVITPTDAGKTMGRFFGRRGPSLYMCYAEADDLEPLRDRLCDHAPNDWTGPPAGAALDNLFVHPRALAGLLLGVSRTTFAWTWSGKPERVLAR